MMMTMMPLDENEDEEETNKKNRNAIDMAVYLVEKKMVKSVEEGLLLISEEDVTTASLLRVKHATKRWSDVIAVDEWKKERAKRSAPPPPTEEEEEEEEEEERERQQQHVKNAKCETGQICFTVQDAREMLERGKGGGSRAKRVTY